MAPAAVGVAAAAAAGNTVVDAVVVGGGSVVETAVCWSRYCGWPG